LFAWWSKIIEIPVIAEGGLNKKVINNVKNVTDFLAFGDELWRANNPLSELNQLLSSLE
jgi:thiamine-phosphate pyrophosphorylase